MNLTVSGTIPIAAILPSTIFHRSTTGSANGKLNRKANAVYPNGVAPLMSGTYCALPIN
jgi:hypothetical protein